MNNFFEHQDRARRTTHYLIFLFGCAIAFTIITIYVACILIAISQGMAISLWNPDWFLALGLVVCCVVSFGSVAKALSLRSGGAVVARSLGGQLVDTQTSDAQERQLLNVVEEMAIAAGVAVPEVYLIPEASINAFAAGLTPNNAVIGVTKGCMIQLNREQLQGVIGHEFSHIINGDMALNLKLMSVVHGLLLIHLIGRELVFSARHVRFSRDKNNLPWFAFALSVMTIGGIGWIFGQLIKSAVSRQREYLADAAAVQFTRNPQGLTDALRCIAQQSASPCMLSSSAESASHLFFNDVSLLGSLASAFATHPPLAKRIRRLGGSTASVPLSNNFGIAQAWIAQISEMISLIQPTAYAASALSSVATSTSVPLVASSPNQANKANKAIAQEDKVSPDTAVLQIGTVTPDHLAQSQTLLKDIPAALIEATRSRMGATSLIYGLLLSEDEETRSHQRNSIAQNSAPVVLAQIDQLAPLLLEVSVRSRLPLLELCIPSLRTLPPAAVALLFTQVKALIQANGKLSLGEFALQSLLQYRLAPHFRPQPVSVPLHSHLDSLWADCWILMSALAQAGHSDPDNADYAFRNGLSYLPGIRRQVIPDMPNSSLHDVSRALSKLRATAPKLKQAIANACAHTILTDSHTTDQETELLRAVLITLGCPIPPFLNA